MGLVPPPLGVMLVSLALLVFIHLAHHITEIQCGVPGVLRKLGTYKKLLVMMVFTSFTYNLLQLVN